MSSKVVSNEVCTHSGRFSVPQKFNTHVSPTNLPMHVHCDSLRLCSYRLSRPTLWRHFKDTVSTGSMKIQTILPLRLDSVVSNSNPLTLVTNQFLGHWRWRLLRYHQHSPGIPALHQRWRWTSVCPPSTYWWFEFKGPCYSTLLSVSNA